MKKPFWCVDAREFIIPITKGFYVFYGYYGEPNACCWIVPGTWREDD